jgi:hypothetical protein
MGLFINTIFSKVEKVDSLNSIGVSLSFLKSSQKCIITLKLIRFETETPFIVIITLFDLSFCAQLCTGSLGDPVVNIDFGSEGGRGGALGSAITLYIFCFRKN